MKPALLAGTILLAFATPSLAAPGPAASGLVSEVQYRYYDTDRDWRGDRDWRPDRDWRARRYERDDDEFRRQREWRERRRFENRWRHDDDD